MSKKNSLKIRARLHAFDLQREAAEKARQQKLADKRQRKADRKGAVAGGVSKHKTKGIRIRKGVRIKGIKVVDADSRRQAQQLLKAEAAMRHMDLDEAGGDAAAGQRKQASGRGAKKKTVRILKKKQQAAAASGSSKGSSRQAAAPGSSTAMDMATS